MTRSKNVCIMHLQINHKDSKDSAELPAKSGAVLRCFMLCEAFCRANAQ